MPLTCCSGLRSFLNNKRVGGLQVRAAALSGCHRRCSSPTLRFIFPRSALVFAPCSCRLLSYTSGAHRYGRWRNLLSQLACPRHALWTKNIMKHIVVDFFDAASPLQFEQSRSGKCLGNKEQQQCNHAASLITQKPHDCLSIQSLYIYPC